MAYTDINSEDRLVQTTFAEYLEKVLGWDSVYAWNQETFGPDGTLGRADTRDTVLKRDLRAALVKLNRLLPPKAIDDAVSQLTAYDFSRSLLQHNQTFYRLIRDGVPVSYRDAKGELRHAQAQMCIRDRYDLAQLLTRRTHHTRWWANSDWTVWITTPSI